MLITMVAGARPNFMKIAPLARAFKAFGISFRIVHTGQHYDEKMSRTFFEELDIPTPDVNLEVGSGSHIWQIAEVLRRIEPELVACPPDAVLVVGDVNSTLAAAIAAVKLGIPVAHVEAGLRSFDRTMPEETNRILTDAISRWLFTSEPSGGANLLREGVGADRIHFVGNVMIDTLMAHRDRADGPRMWTTQSGWARSCRPYSESPKNCRSPSWSTRAHAPALRCSVRSEEPPMAVWSCSSRSATCRCSG
jgi:UDP-N-acetylglucosamine 2-epimerase (non-hydrolysing)